MDETERQKGKTEKVTQGDRDTGKERGRTEPCRFSTDSEAAREIGSVCRDPNPP